MVNPVINHCRCPQLPCGGTLMDSQPATISPGTSPFIRWFIGILLLDIFFPFFSLFLLYLYTRMERMCTFNLRVSQKQTIKIVLGLSPNKRPTGATKGPFKHGETLCRGLVSWAKRACCWSPRPLQEEGTRSWDKEEGQTEGRSRHIHLQDIDLKVSGWVVLEVDVYLQSQQYLETGTQRVGVGVAVGGGELQKEMVVTRSNTDLPIITCYHLSNGF